VERRTRMTILNREKMKSNDFSFYEFDDVMDVFDEKLKIMRLFEKEKNIVGRLFSSTSLKNKKKDRKARKIFKIAFK
jgi:hypothetical protein